MAADVSARVHLVAEKLQQKAQDAQRKGNEGAARALSESVGDLRAAVALIAEQRHLLTRRRGEGADEDARDEQLGEAQALAARLARVQAMLAKKAEEQRAKSNEGAAGALQGASAAVGTGRGLVLAQQQQIFGLVGRWERLQDVLSGRKRSLAASDDGDGQQDAEADDDDDSPQGRVMASVQELVQLRAALETAFPGCRGVEALGQALAEAKRAATGDDAALDEARAQCQRLQRELEHATTQLDETRREAQETSEMLWQQVATLEDAKHALETQREQQTARFAAAEAEHAALEQQQREAQRALEALVRENDEELRRLSDKSAADVEELHLLRADVDAMTHESAQRAAEHAEQVAQLRRELEAATASHEAEDKPEAETTDEQEKKHDVQEEDAEEDEPATAAGQAEEEDETGADDEDDDEDDEDADDEDEDEDEDADVPLLEEGEDEPTELAVEHEVADAPDAREDCDAGQDAALEAPTALAELQTRVAEQHERAQAQQDAIAALERERNELQERLAALTASQTEAEHELRRACEQETARRVAEARGEAARAHQEAVDELQVALERCDAERRGCRLELEAEGHKRSELTTELQAVRQDADEQRSELSELSELLGAEHEAQVTAHVVEQVQQRAWRAPQVATLCRRLSRPLEALLAVQHEAKTAAHELAARRAQQEEQSAVVAELLQVCVGGRRGTLEDTEATGVAAGASSRDAGPQLSAARANVTRWLEQLEQLEKKTTEDAAAKWTLEEDKRTLQQRVASLEAELAAATQRLETQSRSTSEQEQERQAAREQEEAAREQQLAAVRAEFERYRSRSHTALKKMEKRAELLNGMRKENETLLQRVAASDAARGQAEAARAAAEATLREMTRAGDVLRAEREQEAADTARVLAERDAAVQQLSSARDELEAQVAQLQAQLVALERDAAELDEQSRRAQATERATLATRLRDAAEALQEARRSAQEAQDALERSKAEGAERQERVEALETKLRLLEQHDESSAVASSTSTRPDAGRSREADTQLAALRESEAALQQALDATRTELEALQERFATTKAANADKVFTLEQQSRHWETQLSAARDELRRLSTARAEATHGSAVSPDVHVAEDTATTETPDGSGLAEKLAQELAAKAAQSRKLSAHVRELEAELKDAATELTLLTRSLDACRDELLEAQQRLARLEGASAPATNGAAVGQGAGQDTATLVAKEKELKALRVEVLGLQERLQAADEAKAAWDAEREQQELEELRSSRQQLQADKERAMQLSQRKALVAGFQKRVASVVDALQTRLEEHSAAFRDACAFRDEHRGLLVDEDEDAPSVTPRTRGDVTFDECLVMRSGAVIKAGASFTLPVVCEKRGWRVEWHFSVTEDAADVAFRLLAHSASGETELVAPERLHALSGVFPVPQDATTLVFEWDNSFSWLNEKTLDYHVSIQEPLSPGQQRTRRSERELQRKATLLRDALALTQEEQRRRADLCATLDEVRECEAAKRKHVEQLATQEETLRAHKTRVQEDMETHKAALSALLREQDELEDTVRSLERAWAVAEAEREDVEMTLQLAGNGAVLETLAQRLQQQADEVQRQLQGQQQRGQEAHDEDQDAAQEEEAQHDLAQQADKGECAKQEPPLAEEDEPEAAEQPATQPTP